MYRRTLITAFLCVISLPAWADWSAMVEGPDVFGNTKVIATESGFNEGMVVQCDQQKDLFVALLFRKKKFEEIGGADTELLIQTVEGGTPIKLPAALRAWNDDFAGIVASGRSPELVAVLRAISAAKSKINVGAVVRGNQISSSFGAQGSKNAMEKAIKACKLEELEKKS
jgi:hypothetical protein